MRCLFWQEFDIVYSPQHSLHAGRWPQAQDEKVEHLQQMGLNKVNLPSVNQASQLPPNAQHLRQKTREVRHAVAPPAEYLNWDPKLLDLATHGPILKGANGHGAAILLKALG
jgi:hypothetical protein